MTHEDIRAAIAALVEGLTVGVALRVSTGSDVADMVATEMQAHVVAVAVEDGPGDNWGVRRFVARLSAGAMRGCDEVAGRQLLSTLATALRGAMLAQGALGSVGAQVTDAESESITREADAVVLRQTYQLLAPP